MAITVEVKPDFSGFRTPTAEDVALTLWHSSIAWGGLFNCKSDDPILLALAQELLDRYTILPR